MTHAPSILILLLVAAPPPSHTNPCTNGSFEQLAPNGFPADWSAVGTTVEVSPDAHTGKHALRLLRKANTESVETGINRGHRRGDGKQGRMLAELNGGIDFYYKALAANGAELNIYAIPMSDEPREETGSPRATFTVPECHVGDGQWHHGRLAYDFSDDPKVRWVHFAARIVGSAGELLLDDLSYVARTGPILRFGKIRLEEDPEQPGERGTLVVRVDNAGDGPGQGSAGASRAAEDRSAETERGRGARVSGRTDCRSFPDCSGRLGAGRKRHGTVGLDRPAHRAGHGAAHRQIGRLRGDGFL